MEVVDNLVMVVIPGAMMAGPLTLLFWASLVFSLAVAFVAAFPVNRYLVARGMGNAVVTSTTVITAARTRDTMATASSIPTNDKNVDRRVGPT